MITNEELDAIQLSATKKDFYQVWNELLDKASKISNRWDPQNTNESDPGIVLLKVLTACVDKINYLVDVTALENYMPSAAQMESMRKLCDMLGYNIKYYRSATTTAKISFNIPESASELDGFITIDKFTNLKDIDDTINYVTTKEVRINKDMSSVEVPCIEGELVECESDDDNIISLLQLDDNNRYYLPEVQIAENGIFISNISNGYERIPDENDSESWHRVDNLNVERVGQRCYKFGFDSRVNLPYIQFPADISNIIEDGLKIKYIRTNGINGNIAKNTLYKMEKPASWQSTESAEEENINTDWETVDNYTITNLSAAKNGANIESLTDAYSNYKKTIGTFNTLVACRDYMNKIYQLTVSDTDTIPLVSNIIVSDIRDDINKSNIICTFGPYGIEYKNSAKNISEQAEEVSKSDWEASYAGKATAENLNKLYKVPTVEGGNEYIYYRGIFDGNNYDFVIVDTKVLQPFDLVFYPFKTIYGLNTKAEYVKSFKYDDSNILEIKKLIEDEKTLAHNIITPNKSDLACIKNYYNLKATITTNRKVNILEQTDILNNIYTALFENFNLRKLDFGEELAEDKIISIIENADPRIKNVGWQNPDIKTKFCTVAGGEYSTSSTIDETADQVGNSYYNQLVLNNVLAGRISLFNYDENFKPEYNETSYPGFDQLIFPTKINADQTNGIAKIKTELQIEEDASNITLHPNEVVQFRSKNLKTIKTYPAYVNYYLHLNSTMHNIPAIPATMYTFLTYLNGEEQEIDATHIALWESAANSLNTSDLIQDETIEDAASFAAALEKRHALFTLNNNEYSYATEFTADTEYYYASFNKNNVGRWNTWLQTNCPEQITNQDDWSFYYFQFESETSIGRLVDKYHNRYIKIKGWRAESDPFKTYYLPKTWTTSEEGDDGHTTDGLGQNVVPNYIPKDSEYQLKDGEYILFNYTHATSTDADSSKTVINEAFTTDDIIKPNFDLLDSLENRSLHKYTKTNGYDFTPIENPAGMFTLGANEQIELRDFVEIKLDGFINIYWTLNNETVSSNDRIMFPWDENQQGFDEYEQPFYTEYTLKDGEYFFYTNKDKNDLAYYGSGTKLTRTRETPLIYKLRTESTITAQDIAELGISAAIPWRAYNLIKDANKKEALILTEYQYINLTGGSTLIDFDTDAEISNDWTKCKSASYKLSADDNEASLPIINIKNNNWEARSKLELDLGPTKTQTLYKTEKAAAKIWISNKDGGWGESTDPKEIAPNTNEPLSIKANKLIQSTLQETSVGYTNILDTEKQATYYDCQLKIFEAQTLHDANNSTLNLNNFGNGNYTKITFDTDTNTAIDGAYCTFNALIPNNTHFGLITLQYNKIGTSTKNAGIRILKANVTDTDIIEPYIYNYNSDNEWPTEKGWSVDKIDAWATEGVQVTTAEDFNRLKGSSLYIRTIDADWTEADGKYLHTYKDTSTGRKYFEYELVSISATFDINNVYYQLLDLGGKESDDTTNNSIYYLRDGINTICLDGPCTIQIYADKEKKDIIILGGLDLVYKDSPINPKLKYKITSTEAGMTATKQILADINAIDSDHQFYYNVIIDNELALGLNANDENETLESPTAWYNYNNVNNKFVVSEINADYLSTGIVISQNSKL